MGETQRPDEADAWLAANDPSAVAAEAGEDLMDHAELAGDQTDLDHDAAKDRAEYVERTDASDQLLG